MSSDVWMVLCTVILLIYLFLFMEIIKFRKSELYTFFTSKHRPFGNYLTKTRPFPVFQTFYLSVLSWYSPLASEELNCRIYSIQLYSIFYPNFFLSQKQRKSVGNSFRYRNYFTGGDVFRTALTSFQDQCSCVTISPGRICRFI